MIHRVYSTLDTFKNLEFRPGFNLLVAEKQDTSGDLQTRNRAGKSSFVDIVHFLLGGNADRTSIFRKPRLNEAVFGIDFDLGEARVVAERKGNSDRTVIREGSQSDWPVQPSSRAGLGSSFSKEDWREVLGHVWFTLPDSEELQGYRPSFRSLFSYFARREQSEGMRRPEMQSRNQQIWDQHVAVAFLLDLDWMIGSEWQSVRDREKTLKELRRAAKEGAFGEIISSSAQLRTELVVAEQATRRVRESLDRFEVLPEYRQLEREASALTKQMAVLSDEDTLDHEIIDAVRRSVSEELPPDRQEIERLYAESRVVLSEIVRRRFDEVDRFHASVIENRKSYLESEMAAAEARINQRQVSMERMDQRRAEIMRLLRSKGALDQFQRLQEEGSRLNAKIETLRQRFQAAQQLEGVRSELSLDRGGLLRRLQQDLTEQAERVSASINTFQEISTSLYEDAGSLILNATENGLKVEIHIQGERSRGIQNMQVFCFDMMLMRLCAARGIGPKFIIHDSHLFDGVDERQIGKALYIGQQTAMSCGWQYIVTINQDAIPTTVPEGFDLEEFMLPVRITDKEDDGGLFGFRF